MPPSVAKFYSFDGTWRMTEPSWRYLLGQRENVRGSTSYANTLNDPGLIDSAGKMVHRRHHRMAYDGVPVEVTATSLATSAAPAPAVPSYATSSSAAAHAFFRLSHKDQKRSGFANETLCHTDPAEKDTQRWGRLGMMTRERIIASDCFGDIDVGPQSRPSTAMMASRPAATEKTGFTQGPLHHGIESLTGGFIYHEPPPKPKPVADPYAFPSHVVGNKLKTGYTINNNVLETETAPLDAAHYTLMSIGFEGGQSKIDGFGDIRPVPMSAIDVARAAGPGPIQSLQVEPTGFTRTKMHERRLACPIKERQINPTQFALRMMDNPIEYSDPHAHKAR